MVPQGGNTGLVGERNDTDSIGRMFGVATCEGSLQGAVFLYLMRSFSRLL